MNKIITVLTPTNKLENLEYIIYNFNKQTYFNKELIIILNNDEFNLDIVQEQYKQDNIRIIQFPQDKNLSYCLNNAIPLSNGDLITKMDDDDIYTKDYLTNSIQYHLESQGDISGIVDNYIYIEEFNYYGISTTNIMLGGTLIFNKEIFEDIQFKEKGWKPGTVDKEFLNYCYSKGYRIFSRRNDDFIYVRNMKNCNTLKRDNNILRSLTYKILPSSQQKELVNEYKKYL